MAPIADSLPAPATPETDRVINRTTSLLAFFPIALSMLAHLAFYCSRRTRTWFPFRAALMLQIASRYLAIPLGLGLIILGAIVADIEVAVSGIALLAVVYTADMASWDTAANLTVYLRTAPNMYAMSRWHGNPNGTPRTFTHSDEYGRVTQTARRLLAHAATVDFARRLPWSEELALALLARKFVSLTITELCWTETPEGRPVWRVISSLGRWDAGWKGDPGKFLRQWLDYEKSPHSALPPSVPMGDGRVNGQNEVQAAEPEEPNDDSRYEWTLKFVVVLYECIFRSDLSTPTQQIRTLTDVLEQDRSEIGEMRWFYETVRKCLHLPTSARAKERSVGDGQVAPPVPNNEEAAN